MNSRNHDMFGILGQGEKGSQEDPHMSFKTTGGRLSTHVVKKSNSLEPLEKWRGRSLSVPAHWESKQGQPMGRISDSLKSAATVPDDRQDVPVEVFYRHIMQLEDRLHTGAHEVAQLRLQNSTVSREVAAAQGQIQLLTENLRNLEQSQANSLAVRSHDSRSLAVLQHTLQAQHNSVLAEISARDSKAQTTEQDSKQVQSSLNNLLQQLQNSVASGHISVEQVQPLMYGVLGIESEQTYLASATSSASPSANTLVFEHLHTLKCCWCSQCQHCCNRRCESNRHLIKHKYLKTIPSTRYRLCL